MRADDVVSLARAALRGDRPGVHTALACIAANLKRANKWRVAARFEGLSEYGHQMRPLEALPTEIRGLVYPRAPVLGLDELIFAGDVRTQITQLLAEYSHTDALRDAGLQPARRVLLAGPSGNGKTSLAGALALALDRPLYVVSYTKIIGSLLGETAGRLSKVFGAIGTSPCVLLVDEFDAIGSARVNGDGKEVGEMRRVTNSLLMLMEELDPNILMVAATNLPELLDEAVWRRFDLLLLLGVPTDESLLEWAKAALERHRPLGALDAPSFVAALREHVGDLSYGTATSALTATVKRLVTGTTNDWQEALRDWATHRTAVLSPGV